MSQKQNGVDYASLINGTIRPLRFRPLSSEEKPLLVGFGLTGLAGSVAILYSLDFACFTAWLVASGAILGILPRILVSIVRMESPELKVLSARSEKIDVFITTVDEPLSLLESTIDACQRMEGDKTIYLLDDGSRNYARDMCARKGVEYISRSSREGAKAGNLNHALALTSAPFIAVFDADGWPLPSFLKDLTGYFQDPKVAIVQAHSVTANIDGFQNPNAPWENRYYSNQYEFNEISQSACSVHSSAIWSGNGAILRRSALSEVGGVVEGGFTEDFGTSLKLMLAGYKVVYYPRPMSMQLAPVSYHAFARQRARWMMGMFHGLRGAGIRLWTSSKISFRAKIKFFVDALYYFHVPIFFFYNLTIAFACGLNLHFFAHPILGYLGLICQSQGWTRYFRCLDREPERFSPYRIYSILLAVPFMVGFAKLRIFLISSDRSKLSGEFFVTPKKEAAVHSDPYEVMARIYFYLIFCCVALASIGALIQPSLAVLPNLYIAFGLLMLTRRGLYILQRQKDYAGDYLVRLARCVFMAEGKELHNVIAAGESSILFHSKNFSVSVGQSLEGMLRGDGEEAALKIKIVHVKKLADGDCWVRADVELNRGAIPLGEFARRHADPYYGHYSWESRSVEHDTQLPKLDEGSVSHLGSVDDHEGQSTRRHMIPWQ